MKDVHVARNIFICGVVLLFVSYYLPEDIMYRFIRIKPLGLTAMFLSPLLGLFGVYFATEGRNVLYTVLNILLIFVLPMIILIGGDLLLKTS